MSGSKNNPGNGYINEIINATNQLQSNATGSHNLVWPSNGNEMCSAHQPSSTLGHNYYHNNYHLTTNNGFANAYTRGSTLPSTSTSTSMLPSSTTTSMTNNPNSSSAAAAGTGSHTFAFPFHHHPSSYQPSTTSAVNYLNSSSYQPSTSSTTGSQMLPPPAMASIAPASSS